MFLCSFSFIRRFLCHQQLFNFNSSSIKKYFVLLNVSFFFSNLLLNTDLKISIEVYFLETILPILKLSNSSFDLCSSRVRTDQYKWYSSKRKLYLLMQPLNFSGTTLCSQTSVSYMPPFEYYHLLGYGGALTVAYFDNYYIQCLFL